MMSPQPVWLHGFARRFHEPVGRTVNQRRDLDDPESAGGLSAAREDAPARPPPVPRSGRRLSDRILISFHHACDEGDFEVARQLLSIYELITTRSDIAPDTSRRRSLDGLVAAHERLWHLRHPHEL